MAFVGGMREHKEHQHLPRAAACSERAVSLQRGCQRVGRSRAAVETQLAGNAASLLKGRGLAAHPSQGFRSQCLQTEQPPTRTPPQHQHNQHNFEAEVASCLLLTAQKHNKTKKERESGLCAFWCFVVVPCKAKTHREENLQCSKPKTQKRLCLARQTKRTPNQLFLLNSFSLFAFCA